MRFSLSTAYLPLEELPALAMAADRLGYHALAMPDHVVDLEELETPYPYTLDGSRRWPAGTPWPDPWVLTGALAAITTRLRFFSSVYVVALRNPFQVAKSVSTAAALSGGRVALGVGIGWCREEFDLLGQDFRTRASRTDDALALLEELWRPGVRSFAGRHYLAPPLTVEPSPPTRVPVYVGGLSEAAFRRAARHDGWVGDLFTVDEAAAHARRLAELREEQGADGDFSVITALTDAFLPEQFVEAHERGVTDVMTMPWAYYHGLDAGLEQKLDGLERFAADVLEPVGRAIASGK
ncbi:TIGR03619 family F420-dependent LLM class oxidoreductase [Nocardioides sp. TRM66260-LWL]|uniref:TIGR03619 family F420-dependent LLM class oxidoreductase n=1 Tax=Nocardioides sp. TRM66260-LWL TaxID=2874478 RepID=UPI001CC528E6|nr:TIGR03619 family F420-dependent LLM class oxidoreductase [Nocardioides sp. TRM66260-LWL]MBZ5733216.1 TIGR03619 family F420-dependent LLM class oxidoreductase [Nocardioides sp. TRM66260-LWL]